MRCANFDARGWASAAIRADGNAHRSAASAPDSTTHTATRLPVSPRRARHWRGSRLRSAAGPDQRTTSARRSPLSGYDRIAGESSRITGLTPATPGRPVACTARSRSRGQQSCTIPSFGGCAYRRSRRDQPRWPRPPTQRDGCCVDCHEHLAKTAQPYALQVCGTAVAKTCRFTSRPYRSCTDNQKGSHLATLSLRGPAPLIDRGR